MSISVDDDAEQEQKGATIYPRTQQVEYISSTEQRTDINDSVFDSQPKSKTF